MCMGEYELSEERNYRWWEVCVGACMCECVCVSINAYGSQMRGYIVCDRVCVCQFICAVSVLYLCISGRRKNTLKN